jgi:rfaE bifunctional protein kinase chain/domain
MRKSMRTLEQLKFLAPNKRIVIVSGNFNIIHPGHLRLLNFAKSCGELLCIALFDNDSDNIFVNFEDRKAGLLALESVDHVERVMQEELMSFIEGLKPFAVVKGNEYAHLENPEREVLKSYGGKLILGSDEVQFSSKDLIRKEFFNKTSLSLNKLDGFLSGHNSSAEKLIDCVKKFNCSDVLIIGDVILDEYVECEPLGMSQEDPTIVVSPIDKKMFLGGAGIVAAHLASLGGSVRMITVTGKDSASKEVSKFLDQYNVAHKIIKDDSRPTIIKQRFRAGNKTLLRVNHLRNHDVGEEQVIDMLHQFIAWIDTAKCVVFSDFNYGCLPQVIVDKLSNICLSKKIPFFVDSQASSQLGDVSRFKQAELISATEREVRLALDDFKSGLQNIGNNLLAKTGVKTLFLKLGPEGMLVLSNEKKITTDSLIALNSNPKDVAGAGDALLATSVLTSMVGGTAWEAAYLGSVAAGIQVSRVGNYPISPEDLLNLLNN